MATVFFFIALACMVGVLGSLLLGIVAMTKGGEKNNHNSNKMMQARVVLQGLALLFLFLSAMAK